MAGMLYGYPFNEELFSYLWRNEPDVVTTALIDSGVLQNNAEIANLISNGSDTYTVPFYKKIGGSPANYDGKTDIPIVETEGASQSGIVWGRSQGWRVKDFVIDYNSGAEPMEQVASQVKKFWAEYNQAMMVRILNAVFGVTASGSDTNGYYAAWGKHTTNIASSNTTVSDANKLGATSIGSAAVKACGDNAAGAFNLAIMHSTVANNLSSLDLLEFRKYTDAHGIQRTLPIADANGYTVVVYDGVPTTTGGSTAPTYTTYILGTGALQGAEAPVDKPCELVRDAIKNGGETCLVTKERRTMLPNGFTFTKTTADTPSPTDEAIGTSSRWSPVYNPKSIAMARIVSNG